MSRRFSHSEVSILSRTGSLFTKITRQKHVAGTNGNSRLRQSSTESAAHFSEKSCAFINFDFDTLIVSVMMRLIADGPIKNGQFQGDFRLISEQLEI